MLPLPSCLFLFKNLVFLNFYSHVCLCVVCHVLREAGRSQSPGAGVTSGSQCHMWVLGTEFRSSGRVVLVLKHRASSPGLRILPPVFESGPLSESREYYSPFCLD